MNGTMWNEYQMGKGSGSFLLSHGDTLRLTPDIYYLFRSNERIMDERAFDMLQTVEMKVSYHLVKLVRTMCLLQ